MSNTIPPPVQTLITAGLRHHLLLPSDPAYATTNQSSYSSNTAKLTPACIFQPHTSTDVSIALRALVETNQPFAIRSGGHAPYAGASNIDSTGVTIDLGLLDWVHFDPHSETVDIGPGARWGAVYRVLQAHGRVVAGGRDGSVGVGGLLLGGGITFFSARRGLACDDVLGFEVVLAPVRAGGECRIVKVTGDEAGEYADLFRVLKGGSNNFGIVTGFTMRTLPCREVWGGVNIFCKELALETTAALVDFTGRVREDPDSSLILLSSYTPRTEDIISAVYVQVAGAARPPAYRDFLSLPAIADTTKQTTIADLLDEHDTLPKGYSTTSFTATFHNNARIALKATTLHEALVGDLKSYIPNGDFITHCVLQPLPKIYGESSARAPSGDNITGLSEQPVDALLLNAITMVRTREQHEWVYPRVKKWVEDLRDFAERADAECGWLEWFYLNYADGSQEVEVLNGYGGENGRRMRGAAVKYDPQGVFQRLCPGGFKISRVQGE